MVFNVRIRQCNLTNFFCRSLGLPIKVIVTPNLNRCIDCTGLFYNESTSAGCGKKGKKNETFSAIIIILLANWFANKGGALQTKAFAPSILHTAIKLCPEHILEFCPFRYN